MRSRAAHATFSCSLDSLLRARGWKEMLCACFFRCFLGWLKCLRRTCTGKQARSGLEALANATANVRMQGGGGPRDGNGMGGSTGAGHGNSTGTLGATMGSVRVAAGPPPSTSTAEPIGPGMGAAGRWERDREARTPDKRKVLEGIGQENLWRKWRM